MRRGAGEEFGQLAHVTQLPHVSLLDPVGQGIESAREMRKVEWLVGWGLAQV